jgi:hypothetical protein
MADDKKKKGVKQEVYSDRGDLLFTKNIDTAGYAAGAKKFPMTKTLERNEKVKSGTATRKEVESAIARPTFYKAPPEGLDRGSRAEKRAYQESKTGRPDTPLANTPEPRKIK